MGLVSNLQTVVRALLVFRDSSLTVELGTIGAGETKEQEARPFRQPESGETTRVGCARNGAICKPSRFGFPLAHPRRHLLNDALLNSVQVQLNPTVRPG